jgi:transcriptional regulator with XRE-family HTH domain
MAIKGETMGQRLQRLRQAAGMSQSQLAARAGVPLPSLRNWEQDKRTPSLDAAAKVAKAIGCTLEELAGEPEMPTKVVEPRRPGRPRKEDGVKKTRRKGGE